MTDDTDGSGWRPAPPLRSASPSSRHSVSTLVTPRLCCTALRCYYAPNDGCNDGLANLRMFAFDSPLGFQSRPTALGQSTNQPAADQPPQGNSRAGNEPSPLCSLISLRCSTGVYVSSCIDVMTNSLRDAMSKISDIIDLDLVPFGNGSGQQRTEEGGGGGGGGWRVATLTSHRLL